MRKKRRGERDLGECIYGAVCRIFIVSFTILCAYPFYYIFIYSISDPGLARTGVWFWPKGFSLETYRQLFENNDIASAFLISVARTTIGTAITIICTAILAFLVTRREMVGRKFVYRYTVITMYISAGMIPWYILMKTYHLDNSFLLYIIPGAIDAYFMILMKTYMEQIPESMEEAAELEGAGFFDILFRIILPLSKPILATCTVYCAVGQWNRWQDNFFLVRDGKLQTIQLILYNFLKSADRIAQSIKNGAAATAGRTSNITSQSVQMVAIMVAAIPIMLVYPFAQKYFTKGIMMGAVKG